MATLIPSHYTPQQACRAVTFKAATLGMDAYRIALAMSRMTGIDYRGCKKSELCEQFAIGALAHKSGAELRRFLRSHQQ